MISDLFTLAAIVPLEKRSKVEARKQGLHYGVYEERLDKPTKSRSSKSRPRYSNTNSSQPFNLDFNSTQPRIITKSKLTKDEKEVIRETDEEYKLKGHFKRIFPNGNYYFYKMFFTEERPLNVLLDSK
jgi:hypothetical protein